MFLSTSKTNRQLARNHDRSLRWVIFTALVAALSFPVAHHVSSHPAQTDPLPSWNDGAAKKAITELVARMTKEGGADFVPARRKMIQDTEEEMKALAKAAIAQQ